MGVDVELGRGVSLRGATSVGAARHIDDGAVLTDTDVGAARAAWRRTRVATGADIAAGARVGPLVNLGPAGPATSGAKSAANGAPQPRRPPERRDSSGVAKVGRLAAGARMTLGDGTNAFVDSGVAPHRS